MNNQQWQFFCDFKNQFRQKVDEWNKKIPELIQYEQAAAIQAGTPSYNFENAIVYNTDLDKITQNDDIKLIVIGDNPGKAEQLNQNKKYLCGQAGKIAQGFFDKNDCLGINFRKNVIILNKTPIHSAKTNQLKMIMQMGGQKTVDLVLETQIWMAQWTAKLHQQLQTPELWLVGYSELKEKGFFIPYKQELFKAYFQKNECWEKVFVFQHFSMNRFTIDLRDYVKNNKLEDLSLIEKIHNVGKFHKGEIF